MMDGKISRKLKGNVLYSCVVPASMIVAPPEQHQRRLQICENNWIRRIADVKRLEGRRMKD